MTDTKRKRRYKNFNGKHLIEVRIKNTDQLFDARDPAPFRERELDDDFVEYVTSSAREFAISAPLKIVIYILEMERPELPRDSIREAIHSYFLCHVDIQRGELKGFMKRAQLFFVVGLLLLVSCLTLAYSLRVPNSSPAIEILREGIVIFGWVSIWKPIELILFDWYPLFERMQFYKKLSMTEVETKFSSM